MALRSSGGISKNDIVGFEGVLILCLYCCCMAVCAIFDVQWLSGSRCCRMTSKAQLLTQLHMTPTLTGLQAFTRSLLTGRLCIPFTCSHGTQSFHRDAENGGTPNTSPSSHQAHGCKDHIVSYRQLELYHTLQMLLAHTRIQARSSPPRPRHSRRPYEFCAPRISSLATT